jgi:predicted nucleotidyltransferase
MIDLYEKREKQRSVARAHLQEQTSVLLRELLSEFFPNQKIWIFGSLVHPGKFHSGSDIDLAIEKIPEGRSEFELSTILAERMGRPVDLVILTECRFRNKILKEALLWMK